MEDRGLDKPLRIAKFGFRSIPPRPGSAGADTCSMELSKRLVKRGHKVIAYNRLYKNEDTSISNYHGIELVYLKTINRAGFDTIIHSAKATFHIIFHNTADIVNIGNGGNSIWGLFLRLFGKKVIVTQDGIDWQRDKWPWYGKLFLYLSAYLTSIIPNMVVFDNPFAKELFEQKFRKKYMFIPSGVDVSEYSESDEILRKLNLSPGEYILFVGRFIPDKGIHYLLPAFEEIPTSKKLVLVGGSPNPSAFEKSLRKTTDPRVVMPGFIYGNDMLNLIKHAYLYVQPSDVEGLSPVILTVMALETPILCSDIRENLYVVGNTALTFKKSDIQDITEKLVYALANPEMIKSLSVEAKEKVLKEYSWENVTDQYVQLYQS